MDKKTLNFITKANIIHNNKYDYSLVNYTNSRKNVDIICVEHGVFKQRPSDHLNGQGCPICEKTQNFILKANLKHNNLYSYDNTNFVNSSTKVCITCPIHGDFYQLPHAHLNGQGCPKCVGRNLTIDEVINKCNKIHHNKYDYSNLSFNKIKDKVSINCPIHGTFEQCLMKHLNGQGCPKCAHNYKKNNYIFIQKAKQIHRNYYDYSLVEYDNNKNNVKIICPIHGIFEQTPNNHLAKHGCPKCVENTSSYQKELIDFIQNVLSTNVVINDRKQIEPYELDIYIPTYQIAIEFNGLYWHSDKYVDENYHLLKTNLCKEKGIQLIHIFEDEWVYKKDIVKSRLRNLFHKNERVIYARKCIVKNIDFKITSDFLNKNHIQGNCISRYRYGLYYNNELVSIMTFGYKRKSLGSINDGSFELLRFCNELNTTVIGGASKLLNYFIDEIKPSTIISYCDLRWSNGNLYRTLKFSYIHTSRPNYFYVIGNKRENRYKYRKNILMEKYNCSKDISEKEFMSQNNIKRIYDCGSMLFAIKLKES